MRSDLTAQAHRDIEHALAHATAEPYAVSSFGKDSLVLLHLLSAHGVRNVLHLQDADEVVDWPFINEVIANYDLHVTMLSRGRAMFMVVNDMPVFTALTFVSDRHLAVFPTTMAPYTGRGSYVCVDGELHAMRATALDLQFDLLFSGAKRSDLTSKACLSFMNLLPTAMVEQRARESFATEVYRDRGAGVMSCEPLLHWTDADVWAYIDVQGLPWSHAVYHDDHTKKPTGMQWCYRCHDPREASIVACPRIGKNVLNLAAMTQDSDLQIEKLGRIGMLNQQEVEALRA